MRLTKLVFTIVAILTMAISCSISPDNSGVDVVVSLEDKSITESTLIPDYIPDVETYTVSLAEIVYKNGEWQIADGYSRITENFPGSTKEFRFENVRLGTYAVSIEALDEKSLPILNGSGVENLSVTANGLNTVTVELAAISDATYTGSASMTFDWADVALTNDTVKNAMEEGGLVFILYRYDEAEKTWIEAGRSEATGKEATRLEFVVDKLPVSSGLRLKYAIATASGMMLNPILTTPIAQIYANLTSVQDVNGDKIYRINANEISSATNVYDVQWAYGPAEGSSVTVSWKNQKMGNEILFDYVVLKYTSTSGKSHEERIDVTSENSSYIISDMEMGDEYTLSFQAHHKTGLVSPVYTYPEKISAEVLLAAPENLKAEKDLNAINLSWDSVSGAKSYIVYRSVDGKEFAELATVETANYADSALFADKEYAYKVIAVRDDVKSDFSEATETLRIAASIITITTTAPDNNFAISINESDKMVITPASPELTVSVDQIENVFLYTWYINGTEVKSATAEEGGTFITFTKETDGIRTDVVNGLNTLMLEVTTAKESFSDEVKFSVVSVLDEGVVVTVPDNQTRLSTEFENGEKRTVQLIAKVLPDNATLQSVTYVSDNEEIASVNAAGIITFTGGNGKVTITVSPSYGHSESVVFDIFEASFNSAEEIVNAVNKELNKHVAAANSKFGGDWWPGEIAKGYSSDGIYIKESTGASQKAGYIEFSSYTAETEIGPITIDGKLMIYAYNPGGWGETGYLGKDPLQFIGYGDDTNTLTVSLPGNQGTVSIKYSKVDVINRGGSYALTFSETVGYKEGQFHGGSATVPDSSSISEIL